MLSARARIAGVAATAVDRAGEEDWNSSSRDEEAVEVTADPRVSSHGIPELGNVRGSEVLGQVVLGVPPFEDHYAAGLVRIGGHDVVQAARLSPACRGAHDEVLQNLIAVRPVVEPARNDEIRPPWTAPQLTSQRLKLPPSAAHANRVSGYRLQVVASAEFV